MSKKFPSIGLRLKIKGTFLDMFCRMEQYQKAGSAGKKPGITAPVMAAGGDPGLYRMVSVQSSLGT